MRPAVSGLVCAHVEKVYRRLRCAPTHRSQWAECGVSYALRTVRAAYGGGRCVQCTAEARRYSGRKRIYIHRPAPVLSRICAYWRGCRHRAGCTRSQGAVGGRCAPALPMAGSGERRVEPWRAQDPTVQLQHDIIALGAFCRGIFWPCGWAAEGRAREAWTGVDGRGVEPAAHGRAESDSGPGD